MRSARQRTHPEEIEQFSPLGDGDDGPNGKADWEPMVQH